MMEGEIMTDVILWAIIFVTAIGIYIDATANRIGKIPGKRSLTNNPAGVWATGVILLWIVVFPLYLIKRGKLIELANENPVIANNRAGIIVLMSFIGCAWIALMLAGSNPNELPMCDSAEANNTMGTIINSHPETQKAGIRYISVTDVVERGYNLNDGIRACSATMVTNQGELPVQYNVKWTDSTKTMFEVKIVK